MSDQKKTVTKENLAEILQSEIGISKAICEEIVVSLFDEILNLVETNNKVVINNFGKFYINSKKSRPGFNIRLSAPVAIEARKVLRFAPSRALKNLINVHDK